MKKFIVWFYDVNQQGLGKKMTPAAGYQVPYSPQRESLQHRYRVPRWLMADTCLAKEKSGTQGEEIKPILLCCLV